MEVKDRFAIPSDIPRKSVDKKQLKCFNIWKKYVLDEKTKKEEKWTKYKKEKKCNSFKKFVDCNKDKDKKGCQKEKDSLLKLLKAYHHFEKYFVKPLEKLEEGMKDGVYNKKNAKTIRVRRRLAMVDMSKMKYNKPPSNPFMFVAPSDLHHLKSYISDGTHYAADSKPGPNQQERRLFETYYKQGKEAYDQEVQKLNLSKKQTADLGRKLKMMEDFTTVTDGAKDVKVLQAGADLEKKQVDGAKASNLTKASHIEKNAGTNISPDGLTATAYDTTDITTSQNDNSTENLAAVQVKGTKMLQGNALSSTLSINDARNLEKAKKEDDDDDDDRRLDQDDQAATTTTDQERVSTVGVANKKHGTGVHVEKTQASQISSDGLTVQKYNT